MFKFALGLAVISAPFALTAWLVTIKVHPALAVAAGVVILIAIGKGLE